MTLKQRQFLTDIDTDIATKNRALAYKTRDISPGRKFNIKENCLEAARELELLVEEYRTLAQKFS